VGDIKGGSGGRRRRWGWPSARPTARQSPVRRRRCAAGLGGGESGTSKAGGRGVGFGEGRGEVGLELEAWVLGGRRTARGHLTKGCLGWWDLSMRAGDSWAWAVPCTCGATGLTSRFSSQLVNELALDYSLKKRSILFLKKGPF